MTNVLGLGSASCVVAAVAGLVGRWWAVLAAGLILAGMAYVSSTQDAVEVGGEDERLREAVEEAGRRAELDKQAALARQEAEITGRLEPASFNGRNREQLLEDLH